MDKARAIEAIRDHWSRSMALIERLLRRRDIPESEVAPMVAFHKKVCRGFMKQRGIFPGECHGEPWMNEGDTK